MELGECKSDLWRCWELPAIRDGKRNRGKGEMDSRVDRREGNQRILIPETRGVFQKECNAIIIAHRRME